MLLSEFLARYPEIDVEGGVALTNVAALAQQYDRTGSLTVKFKAAKANSRVLVTVGVESKEPQPDPEAGLWHLAPDGLSKDDPGQGRLDVHTGEIHLPKES